jgi:hypothetical protein
MSRSDDQRISDILDAANRIASLIAEGRKALDESPS